MSDKKAQQVLKELFIGCRKLNISLCFLTQPYFSVPKDLRLNIAINHSSDIDYKDFVKIYKKCTENPYNFLTIDTTVNKLFKNFDESLKK